MLNNASNDFQGGVTATGGNVTLVDANTLTLAGVTANGTFSANGTTINQTGAVSVTGTSSLNGGEINLGNASNDFGGAVTATGTNVTLADANTLTLGGVTASGNFAATVPGGGAIIQTGSVLVTGETTLTGGTINLGVGTNDFVGGVTATGWDVTLADANNLTIANVTTGNAMSLFATGLLSQTGAVNVAGPTTLSVSGDILLNNASNNFGGAVTALATNVTLADANDLTLGTVTAINAVNVSAVGNITGGLVDATSLVANSSAGSIDLNVSVATASATALGNVELAQSGNQAVTFTNVTSTNGNVSLSTDGTTNGTGMTLGTLSAGGVNGTVTVSGGVEYLLTNNTTYTTTNISDGQLVLSGANLLLSKDPAYKPALGTAFPIIQTTEPISGTFTNLAQNGSISTGGFSFNGNYTNNLTLTSTTDAPRVTNVYVNGNGTWSSNFTNFLGTEGIGNATLGYRIPTGAVAAFNRGTPNQLNTIPWFNVNQIRVTFSEDVAITASDFAITGVNTATYVGAFTYGLVGGVYTATWTYATALPIDKLLVNVAGAVSSPTSGLQLAGSWTEPTPTTPGSAMPSGLPSGTPFRFRINMAPGDANSDTGVTSADVSIIRAALFTSTTSPGSPPLYTVFKDINGDGSITNADVAITRSLLFTQLPGGEPTPQSFAIVSPSVEVGSFATSGGITLDQARQIAFAALADDVTGTNKKK